MVFVPILMRTLVIANASHTCSIQYCNMHIKSSSPTLEYANNVITANIVEMQKDFHSGK